MVEKWQSYAGIGAIGRILECAIIGGKLSSHYIPACKLTATVAVDCPQYKIMNSPDNGSCRSRPHVFNARPGQAKKKHQNRSACDAASSSCFTRRA